MAEIEDIVSYIQELQEDETVPRNVKQKLMQIAETLKSDSGEISIKIDKMLYDLEELSNDINIPSFVRTQVWNICSMLESMNSK